MQGEKCISHVFVGIVYEIDIGDELCDFLKHVCFVPYATEVKY